jgi:hypothetical protein
MHLGYRPSRESENQQSVWRRSLLSEFRFIIAIAGVLLGIPVGWTATNRFDALTPPADLIAA